MDRKRSTESAFKFNGKSHVKRARNIEPALRGPARLVGQNQIVVLSYSTAKIGSLRYS